MLIIFIIEEDTRLYGARPVPATAAVIDATLLPFEPPQKRNASHLTITMGRPSKSRIVGDDRSNISVLTATVWINGVSLIATCINQSAVPSTTPTKDESEGTDESLIAQEAEEMKMFRNVHVKTAPCPTPPDDHLMMDKDFATLSPEAQIFYRDLKSRFAHIYAYLTRLLANANLDKAERLQKIKQACAQHGLPLLEENPFLSTQ